MRPPNKEIEPSGESCQSVVGKRSMKIDLEEKNYNEMRIDIPKIFESAIASAQKHRINLVPGRENNGDGNCSYESVIF